MSLQQQLTSYYTSESGVPTFPSTGGGGGSSNTLNNGRRTTITPASFTATPSAVHIIATTSVTATYDSSSPRYLPLCFAQLTLLEVATTSPLTPGDTVTFYYDVSSDSGASNSLPGVTTPASALVGGYTPVINSSGVLPLVLPGARTYTFNLCAIYDSSATATIDITFPRQGLITAQVVACAAPII